MSRLTTYFCFLLLLLTSCASKTASTPKSPYIKMVTLTSVIAETNHTVTQTIIDSHEMGILSRDTTNTILNWNEVVAKSTKQVSLELAKPNYDPAVVRQILREMVIPPVVQSLTMKWDPVSQQSLILSIRLLTSLIEQLRVESVILETPLEPIGHLSNPEWRFAYNRALVAA